MTTLTYPSIPITPEISAAFAKGRCDDADHGKPMTKICQHAKKCIVVKRASHRWAIIHDEEGGFDDNSIPLVWWHPCAEAPVSMGRLAGEDVSMANYEMWKLKAIAALIRDGPSDESNDAERLTPTASQDSEMSVSDPISVLVSKQAREIALGAERALKAMDPKEKEQMQQTEPNGMEDSEDWEVLDVEPISQGWIWIRSEAERRKAFAARQLKRMAEREQSSSSAL